MSKEEKADAVIAEFNTWFQSLPNEPLVRAELAILKSFLFYLDRTGCNTNLSDVVVTTKEKTE